MIAADLAAPVDLAAPEPIAPTRWVVCYGHRYEQEAYYRDRGEAEKAVIKLHGVLTPMVNLKPWPGRE